MATFPQGRVLHDSAVAAALVDRLMHHGDVYRLTGESYQVRGKPRAEVLQAPAPDPLPAPLMNGSRENPAGSSSTPGHPSRWHIVNENTRGSLTH